MGQKLVYQRHNSLEIQHAIKPKVTKHTFAEFIPPDDTKGPGVRLK